MKFVDEKGVKPFLKDMVVVVPEYVDRVGKGSQFR